MLICQLANLTNFFFRQIIRIQQNRLTEGGWAAHNRAHTWVLVNTLIAVIALGVAMLLANAEC
jgi:hypothetical protein